MKKIILLLFLISLLFATNLPKADVKGSKDTPYLGRYKGSIIIGYKHDRFNKFKLPISKLQKVEGKSDKRLNTYFEPPKVKELVGELTIVTYLMPKGVSSFEVLQNYKDEIAKSGGEILFECEEGCGGNPRLTSDDMTGANDTSLMMYMQPISKVRSYLSLGDAGYCAYTNTITDQHYIAFKIKNSYFGLVTYVLDDNALCDGYGHRAVAILFAITPKQKDNNMVVIKANKMKEKISKEGKIALYGIYFDTDKAVVKPESEPTIKEIAKLLKDNPKLKLLIVGHTDNQGTFVYNKGLSERRAKAVVKELVTKYGINANRLHPVGVSYAAPVASNNTKEGRAKNRRVELVELSK